MDYNAAALAMHEKYHGKLAVESLFSVKDRDALSTAYTPGVAEPCRQIAKNPEDVYAIPSKAAPSRWSPTALPCWAWATSALKPACRSWRASAFCSRSSAAWMRSPSV